MVQLATRSPNNRFLVIWNNRAEVIGSGGTGNVRLCILGHIYRDLEALGETHDDSAVESHISMPDWHTNIAVRPVWSVVLGPELANKHGR
jgi:hypothetical protein